MTRYQLNFSHTTGNLALFKDEASFLPYINNFLITLFKTKFNETTIYKNQVHKMATDNLYSFNIDLDHIRQVNSEIFTMLHRDPHGILSYLDMSLFRYISGLYPLFAQHSPEIHIRLVNSSFFNSVKDLRNQNINSLVKVEGMVTKRTSVYPQVMQLYLRCEKCYSEVGPLYNNGIEDFQVGECHGCQSKGPFRMIDRRTIYRNYQRLTIQEMPNSVEPGRIPRSKEVIVTGDLVDKVRPGEEVAIVGIYKAVFDYSYNMKYSFPVMKSYIEANSLTGRNDTAKNNLTKKLIEEFEKESKKPGYFAKLCNSVAPSIYGNEQAKRAILLSLFGGCPKDVKKHRIRGDINVLLLGDPGTAKSQLLKQVTKIFRKSIFTTGKGASAVGLTASVHKEMSTGEWILEGGAMVMADQGVCLIDEFDKMTDIDRTSIHEAMEQQSISISKAGIVTSLSARCAVIAAANPIKGRYDNSANFQDNVFLQETILSRFDLMIILRDEVDYVQDNLLVCF